jgi:hypothetical protein
MLDKFFGRKEQVGTGPETLRNGKGTGKSALYTYGISTKAEGLLTVLVERNDRMVDVSFPLIVCVLCEYD